MEYKEIGEGLQVHFEAKDMDLLQLGILNSSLHNILNHIAIAIFDETNRVAEEQRKPKVLDHIPQNLNRRDVPD